MFSQRINLNRPLILLAASALAFSVAFPGRAVSDQKPKLGVKESAKMVPNGDGFIQRWLILEPISATGDTQNAVQATVKAERFAEQRTKMPVAGQKVTIDGEELTWHAVDTDEYNVNLYYFAQAVGKSSNNA